MWSYSEITVAKLYSLYVSIMYYLQILNEIINIALCNEVLVLQVTYHFSLFCLSRCAEQSLMNI